MSEGDLHVEIQQGFNRLHERLDVVGEKQAEMNQQLARIEAEYKPIQALVTRHEMDLRGTNGEGLKTRMALVEQEQERIGDPAKRSKRAEKTSVGAGVAAIVAVIWQVIAFFTGGK